MIRKCAESFDIVVDQLEEIRSGDEVVSSSEIRSALESGDIDAANKLLGYSYFIHGKVGNGRQIGREMGFPTANIIPDSTDKLIPKDGVYAVLVTLNNRDYKGMMSVGSNPTVNDDPARKTIEVNIFDFEGDIYDRPIKVVFIKMIREMKKFDGLSDLMAQLEEDKKTALRFLTV
jgi:riboflavin kinase / FMN adenylyltransferase